VAADKGGPGQGPPERNKRKQPVNLRDVSILYERKGGGKSWQEAAGGARIRKAKLSKTRQMTP